MTFFGSKDDFSQSTNKTGVLLVNLGTPDRPRCPSLRKYLSQFLNDGRVIELPKLARWLLVNGVIINLYAHKSAANYRKIWGEQGSPLLTNSLAIADKLQQSLGDGYKVKVAMRYGQPNIEGGIRELHSDGIRSLVVLPMYPQYSGSTTGSCFDALADALKKFRWVPEISFINHYFDHVAYIDGLAKSIMEHWKNTGQSNKLVMSFHGVPQKYSDRGDPYEQHCLETAELLAKKLQLADDQWMLVYQSRFGREPWLQPYCDKTLEDLGQQGVESVDLICPGFSVDCIETLEEIEMQNKKLFLEAGGKRFHYIHCLNDQRTHIELYRQLVTAKIAA